MKLPYPLPLKVPESFLAPGGIRLPAGYSLRFRRGVHYLVFGAEDLIASWPLEVVRKRPTQDLGREINEMIAAHRQKLRSLSLPYR